MSKMQGHFQRHVSLYPIVLELLLVALYHLLDLLLILHQMRLNFLQPLLLCIILQFKYGLWDDSVYDLGVDLLQVDISILLDVDEEGAVDEVLLEV